MAIEMSKGDSAPDGPVPSVPPGTRRLRLASACFTVLALSACGVVTPPPRFSAVSPADPNAPESAVPPPEPMLTGDGELADEPATSPAPPEDIPDMPRMEAGDPHAGHMQHGSARTEEAV